MNESLIAPILSIILFLASLVRWRTKLKNIGPVIVYYINKNLDALDKVIFAAEINRMARLFAEILVAIFTSQDMIKISDQKLNMVKTTLLQLTQNLGEL